MGMRGDLPIATGSAADFIPPRPTLDTLREAARGCRGCRLWTVGTQTVFGEGPRRARVMLVGEQPGDQEDKEGHPFVGPAGAARQGVSRDEESGGEAGCALRESRVRDGASVIDPARTRSPGA